MLEIRKATRARTLLRLGIFGVSGSGKTLTALKILTGMGCKKICVIDSERGRSNVYGPHFNFHVCELQKRTVEEYIQALQLVASQGYDGVSVDSSSHGWEELKEENDRVAQSRFKGNVWAAWSESTPKQRSFIEAITTYPGHVILTMRSKTLWEQEDENGKKKPTRVGVGFEQRPGTEYELDLLMMLDAAHNGTILKAYDFMAKFQDRSIKKPGEELGQELLAFLREGSDEAGEVLARQQAPARPAAPPRPAAPAKPAENGALLAQLQKELHELGSYDALVSWWGDHQGAFEKLSQVQIGELLRTKDQVKDRLKNPPARPTIALDTPAPEEAAPLFQDTGAQAPAEPRRIPENLQGITETGEMLKKLAKVQSKAGCESIQVLADAALDGGVITTTQHKEIYEKINERFKLVTGPKDQMLRA